MIAYYGIAAVEAIDSQGDIIDMATLDVTKLVRGGFLIQSFSGLKEDHILGYIAETQKFFRASDLRSAEDLELYELADSRPFLKVVIQTNDVLPLTTIGSYGRIMEREGAWVKKAMLSGIFLTSKPVHKAYRLFRRPRTDVNLDCWEMKRQPQKETK